MLVNLSPLRKHADYRYLFLGQTVSFLGSMVSYVAVPYQVYQLTKSSFIVGLIGFVQLIPVVIFGFIGGSTADQLNRKKLLLYSEVLISLGCLLLAFNSMFSSPSVAFIFVVTAIMQAVNAFHRPAMEAMTQKVVNIEDMPAVAALGSIKYSTGAIVGPALGGMLIAQYGATTAYLFDFATFAFSWFMILKIKTVHFQLEKAQSKLSHIKEGLIFAVKKPELLGTYIVDIVAMTFAFPTALFPEMSEKWGGAKAAGFLFSAMAAGSLITSVFSRWTEKFSRRGLGVVLAAGAWGFAIIGLGFSHSLWWAVIFLAFAGAFDNISGIFRQTIWNETIPNNFRGRLAGIEMISYMSGPLLGQLRAGWMAGFLGVQWAIVWGGVLCVIGVTLCAIRLKGFWLYKKINLQL